MTYKHICKLQYISDCVDLLLPLARARINSYKFNDLFHLSLCVRSCVLCTLARDNKLLIITTILDNKSSIVVNSLKI